MMIRVTGGDKTINPDIMSASKFYLETLLGSRLAKNISVTIRLRKDMTTREGMVGSCIYMDQASRPRDFEILLDKSVPRKVLLETLAHEMVHVKQYARGEMRDCGRTHKFYWMGQECDYESMEYFDHPWEIEAHGRERGLFHRWIMKMGYETQKWTFDW